jgi:hypothetical protein
MVSSQFNLRSFVIESFQAKRYADLGCESCCALVVHVLCNELRKSAACRLPLNKE